MSQKLTEKLAESKRFIHFVIRHFFEDDCTYHASALAFTTLLAVVPIMSLGFAILSTFPVFQDLAGTIQNFILQNFVPTTGQIIQDFLKQFSMQASRLSVAGVIFLFMIALLVMYTIEQSMNKIWRVSVSRRGILAFLLYWAIVSLAPFLLGLSIAVSSYVLSTSLIQNYHLLAILGYSPFLLSLAGFTFLYIVVPNCKVRFLHGLIGAFVATLLFESAKQAFAYYLSQVNFYQLLYGAFATVPIFIMWIYWVWIITLLGAEICYALSVHHQRRTGIPMDGFSHALFWLYQLRLMQLEGKGLTIEELINSSPQAYEIEARAMLSQLKDLQLIKKTSDGHYILSRNLNHISLYDLTQLLPYRLPRAENLNLQPKTAWHTLLQKADIQLQQTLMISLEQLFQKAS